MVPPRPEASPPVVPAQPTRSAALRLLAGAATALLVAGGLTGCSLFGGSDDASSTSTTARPTTSTSTSTTVAPARSDPPELLDAGAEPRQPLRIAYTEGQEATVELTSDVQVEQRSDGRTQRLDSPPIVQTLAYRVGTVTDQGAQLTIEVTDVAVKSKGTGLTDDEVAKLQDELDPLVGLEATATATPLGELQDVAFDVPDGLSEAATTRIDALDDQISALGPSLPTEPVGVGARWRTTAESTSGGARATTVTTVTLTSTDDDGAGYTSTIETTADAQELALDGLADGTTARLESSKLTGTSRGTLRLDGVGLSLRTTLAGTQQIVLVDPDGETPLTQSLELAYVGTTSAG